MSPCDTGDVMMSPPGDGVVLCTSHATSPVWGVPPGSQRTKPFLLKFLRHQRSEQDPEEFPLFHICWIHLCPLLQCHIQCALPLQCRNATLLTVLTCVTTHSVTKSSSFLVVDVGKLYPNSHFIVRHRNNSEALALPQLHIVGNGCVMKPPLFL